MQGIKEICDALSNLKREEIAFVILEMMKDGKVSYKDITDIYVEYLEFQKKNISDEYQQLKNMVITTWCEPKKNIMENMKNTMLHLLRKGQINMTEDKIKSRK